MGVTAFCPLCRKWWVPTFTTEDDPTVRFSGHYAASGYRKGRECDNSGQPVRDGQYQIPQQSVGKESKQ